MAFTFCQHCGTKHEYSSARPNFCTNCGTSFAGVQVSVPQPKEEIEKNQTQQPKTSFSHLQKLDYEIINNDYVETTLGSVVKEEKLGISIPRKRRKSLTGDAIKDCVEECKPVRGSINIDE